MIRTSPATIRRAAAVVLAAAVFPFLATHASAQQVVDLFGGQIGTPTGLSITTPTLPPGTAATGGTFGPAGYSGSLSLGLSSGVTYSESFSNPGTGNTLSFALVGTAGAGASASATKTFGAILAASTTYSFTLTSSSSASLALLSNFDLTLSNSVSGQFLDTASGQGLAGIVNVLGIFGNTSTNTFQFTTPPTYNPTGNLNVTFTQTLLAGAGSSSLSLTNASINQVPEPGTTVAMLLGAGGLVALRFRRRLAAV